MALEKPLQSLIEKYLDTFLGFAFLASEYSTGPQILLMESSLQS
jgi:hypothetical protein